MSNDRIWMLLTRKLSGEATQTELEELYAILAVHPEQLHSIEEITQLWNQVTPQDTDFMEATFLAHVERMKSRGIILNTDEPVLDENEIEKVKSISAWKKFRIGIFATLAIIIIFAGWSLLHSKNITDTQSIATKTKEVKTLNGTRTKIILPDGSHVWLNAGSKLNYQKKFDSNVREVFLSGEAYFDVVHNAKKPFIIHTATINIKVLGTQFNVKAYDDDKITETSLIKGSVEISLKKNASKKYILKPNQKLVLLNEILLDGDMKVKSTHKDSGDIAMYAPQIKELTYLKNDNNTNVESSWTRNILSFEDEPFYEVAKKLERWYDVSIIFENKRWEHQYMSGAFENENLAQAMNALKFTTGFNYKQEGNTIIIY
ncbi:MAG: FecR family protein [Niastella sp.]|nr:FecR family protein [Niastella sp.]